MPGAFSGVQPQQGYPGQQAGVPGLPLGRNGRPLTAAQVERLMHALSAGIACCLLPAVLQKVMISGSSGLSLSHGQQSAATTLCEPLPACMHALMEESCCGYLHQLGAVRDAAIQFRPCR